MGFREQLKQSLRQAFAVPDSTGPLSQRQAELIDAICREIVRRRLTLPAVVFLEMSRPLNYLGAQALHFFQPLIAAISDSAGPEEFARFLERRDSIDLLAARLEELEEAQSVGPASDADQ